MAVKLHHFGKGPRGGEMYCFHCPGCGYGHPFEVDAPNGAGWEWNRDWEKPTFKPSLLIWGTVPEMRCHSFVTDGKIQFLSDSYHSLAGQTVDIPDWDDG